MSRIRLVAVTAATIVCAFALTGAAQAQTAPELAKTVKVTGTKGFTGTYTIQRFTSKGNKLYTVGTLKGKLNGAKKVTKKNVLMPASVTGQNASAAQLPPIPTACQVLNLVLGPININLLGLSVRTNQINLRIDAIPGAGNLLGNLLCGITNLINPAQTPLNQLTAALNAILALLNV